MAQGKSRLDLLQGTLDLLILRALRADAMHGWAISERIQQISRDVLQVNKVPSIRLFTVRTSGLIKAEWGISELGGVHVSIHSQPRGASSSRSKLRTGTHLLTPLPGC